jgi:diamine N-acetyltransferase
LTINLQEINASNWEECIQLKTAKEQQSFVASNLYSLAESKFFPSYTTLGIYVDETMVGFVMYGIDVDDGNYWIYRIMIDEKYQKKGYGKSALLQVIDRLEKIPEFPVVMIGFHDENVGAKELYKSVGFEIGEIAPWGERLACYYFR